MSIHPQSAATPATHIDVPLDEEATLPAHSGVQAWLQELAENELVLDRINSRELTQRIMQEAFGRYTLPPRVAGLLAANHLLRDASPQDRQGIRQLATAWFTSIPPSAVDDSTWSVRQAVRRPQTPHLTLTGHTGDVTDITRRNAIAIWERFTRQYTEHPNGWTGRSHPFRRNSLSHVSHHDARD